MEHLQLLRDVLAAAPNFTVGPALASVDVAAVDAFAQDAVLLLWSCARPEHAVVRAWQPSSLRSRDFSIGRSAPK